MATKPTTEKHDAFEEWMDGFWPLWRQHTDKPRVAQLRAAWNAASINALGDSLEVHVRLDSRTQQVRRIRVWDVRRVGGGVE
jgi:hypothetical protein